MNPLIKNDLRWALPLGIAGLVIYPLIYMADTPAHVWVFPDNVQVGAITLYALAFGAAVLGLVAALVESVTRSREYLLHRPVPVGRIFWTRQAVCLTVMASWIVLPPLLYLAGCYLLSDNVALFDEGRLPIMIAQGLPALLFYALAVWVGSVARRVIPGLLLLAATGVPVFILTVLAVMGTTTIPSSLAIVASLALAALLLRAALGAQRAGRDADRPWSAATFRVGAPTAVLVAVLAGGMGLSLLQVGSMHGLLDTYPFIGERDGKPVLYRWDDWERRYYLTDQQHQSTETLAKPPNWLWSPVDDGWTAEDNGKLDLDRFPHKGRHFRGQFYDPPHAPPNDRRVYLGSDGHVHLYRLAGDRGLRDGQPQYLRLGKAPDGRPFSAQARNAQHDWDRVGAIFDPEDGAVWIYDLRSDARHFTRAALPEGDRYVGAYDRGWELPYWERGPSPSPLIVTGARGIWALGEGAQFQPYTPQRGDRPDRREDDVRVHSPTSFTASLRSKVDGQVLYSHTYRPYTAFERLAAAGVYATTPLRPSLLSVLSLTTPEAKAYEFGRLLLDPAVARGGAWLVPLNVLVSLALALLGHRRLGRLGLPAGRRWFWLAAVVLGGFPAYLCQRFVETERAWKPLPAPARPRATPVLLSPAAPLAGPRPV